MRSAAKIPADPAERLQRFVRLQRRAQEILAASSEGLRRYWERNLRKRRCDARF